jgi:hypothetical protein
MHKSASFSQSDPESTLMYADIDTSAAGFGQGEGVNVHYFASLSGQPSFQGVTHWHTVGAGTVYWPTPTGFRVYIELLGRKNKDDGYTVDDPAKKAEQLQWSISWYGVETAAINGGGAVVTSSDRTASAISAIRAPAGGEAAAANAAAATNSPRASMVGARFIVSGNSNNGWMSSVAPLLGPSADVSDVSNGVMHQGQRTIRHHYGRSSNLRGGSASSLQRANQYSNQYGEDTHTHLNQYGEAPAHQTHAADTAADAGMAAMDQAMALQRGSKAETAGQQGDGDGDGGATFGGESLAQHNAAAAAEVQNEEGENLPGGVAQAAEVASRAKRWARQRAASMISNNQALGNEERADEGQMQGEGEGGRRLVDGRRRGRRALEAGKGNKELQLWIPCAGCEQIVEEELEVMLKSGLNAGAVRKEEEEEEEQLVPTFVAAPFVAQGSPWRRSGSPFVGHLSDTGGGFGLVLGEPLAGPTSSAASGAPSAAPLLDATFAQQHWGASFIAFLPPAAAELVIVRLRLAEVTITPSEFRRRGAGSVHDGLRSALASALEVPPHDVGLFDAKWERQDKNGGGTGVDGSRNLVVRVEIKVVSMGVAERVMATLQEGPEIAKRLTQMLHTNGEKTIDLPADQLSFSHERETRIDVRPFGNKYGRFSNYPWGVGWFLATIYGAGSTDQKDRVADRALAALVVAGLAALCGFLIHHCQAMAVHRLVVDGGGNEGETAGLAGRARKMTPEAMSRKAGIRHFQKKKKRHRRNSGAGRGEDGDDGPASRVTVRVVGGGSWWEEVMLVLTSS